MPIDFRALVEEVCRAEPMREGPDALPILVLFLEQRLYERNLVIAVDREATQRNLESEVGPEDAKLNLTDDEYEYLVERFVNRLEADPPPHQAILWVLERTLDERAVDPAIRVIRRFSEVRDDYSQQFGGAALSILARYQDRPEVWDSIEFAARHGRGHVGDEARSILLHRRNEASQRAN